MDTIFLEPKDSETSDQHRLSVNLTGKKKT